VTGCAALTPRRPAPNQRVHALIGRLIDLRAGWTHQWAMRGDLTWGHVSTRCAQRADYHRSGELQKRSSLHRANRRASANCVPSNGTRERLPREHGRSRILSAIGGPTASQSQAPPWQALPRPTRARKGNESSHLSRFDGRVHGSWTTKQRECGAPLNETR
jgi:hypothetical protein